MRMGIRRFTRLTNGFSKKLENHRHAVALYFTHYNFCRIHKSLRVTPAMEAGLTDHVWTLEDLTSLLGNNADKPCESKSENEDCETSVLRTGVLRSHSDRCRVKFIACENKTQTARSLRCSRAL